MAYKVIILYRLYMPSYFLGTFTEYPILRIFLNGQPVQNLDISTDCFFYLTDQDVFVCGV